MMRSISVWALLLSSIGVACSCQNAGESSVALRTEEAETCVVAWIGGEPLLKRRVNTLQAVMHPPPPEPGVDRLALEVALVAWSKHGTIDVPLQRQRASYNELMADTRKKFDEREAFYRAWEQRLAGFGHKSGLQWGECSTKALRASLSGWMDPETE